MSAPSNLSADPVGILNAVGRFIGRNGFATLIALILLWWVLFRNPDAVSADVKSSRADIARLQSDMHAHASEMTDRIVETKQWNSQMLRFAYLACLREAKKQQDRDVCEAVLR